MSWSWNNLIPTGLHSLSATQPCELWPPESNPNRRTGSYSNSITQQSLPVENSFRDSNPNRQTRQLRWVPVSQQLNLEATIFAKTPSRVPRTTIIEVPVQPKTRCPEASYPVDTFQPGTAQTTADSQAAHQSVRATLCLPVRTALLRDVVHEDKGWKDRRVPSARSRRNWGVY